MKARVLVVDDEPVILRLLRDTLGDDVDVVLARDGDTALRRVEESDVNLVLLDLMMPTISGWGVLEALRDRDPAPPVVVISARVGPDDMDRALELGAVDIVSKPFEPEEVASLVAELVTATPAELAEHRRQVMARYRRS